MHNLCVKRIDFGRRARRKTEQIKAKRKRKTRSLTPSSSRSIESATQMAESESENRGGSEKQQIHPKYNKKTTKTTTTTAVKVCPSIMAISVAPELAEVDCCHCCRCCFWHQHQQQLEHTRINLKAAFRLFFPSFSSSFLADHRDGRVMTRTRTRTRTLASATSAASAQRKENGAELIAADSATGQMSTSSSLRRLAPYRLMLN